MSASRRRRRRATGPIEMVQRGIKQLALLDTLRATDRGTLRGDAVAALTTAAMLVPQSMAYAALAELPPYVGLYASTLPLLLYAILGRTPELAVGPVAMASLLLAEGVSELTAPGTVQFLDMAVQLAFMVGAIQVAIGLLRLGFLATLISYPVMSGFTSAAAVLIALSQLQHALGVKIPRLGPLDTLGYALSHRGEINLVTTAMTVGGVAVLASFKRWLPKAPGALVVLAICTLITWLAGLANHGVAVVGKVPSGLPPLYDLSRLGAINWDLAPVAGLVAVLSFLEAIAVSERFGREKHRDVDHNLELVGVGLANIGSGIVSGMPLSGALSRSAVQAGAGAVTGLTNIFTGAVTVLTLLLLTPVFANVPRAALAAIVLSAVVGLFDVGQAVKLWRFRRLDFGVLLLTFSVVLIFAIEHGVIIGIATSLGIFVLRTTRPNIVELGELVADPPIYHDVERYHDVRELPGILVVRIDAAFYFANASYLVRELRRIEREREESGDRLWAVVIDCSGINHLDSVGEHGLRQLLGRFTERDTYFYLAQLKGEVYDVLEASGFLDEIGREHLALNIQDAVNRAKNKRGGGAGESELDVDVHEAHGGRPRQGRDDEAPNGQTPVQE